MYFRYHKGMSGPNTKIYFEPVQLKALGKVNVFIFGKVTLAPILQSILEWHLLEVEYVLCSRSGWSPFKREPRPEVELTSITN